MEEELSPEEYDRRKKIVGEFKKYKDVYLLSWISSAKDGKEVSITLLVGGMMVSGYVIPYSEYVRMSLSEDDQSSLTPDQLIKNKEILDQAKMMEDAITSGSESENFDTYIGQEFIHLKNARVFIPGNPPFPAMGNPGTLWRVRIRAVDGHTSGIID